MLEILQSQLNMYHDDLITLDHLGGYLMALADMNVITTKEALNIYASASRDPHTRIVISYDF